MTLDQVIALYCDAWGEPDPVPRRAMIERVWAEGATYTDPGVHLAGAAALAEHIGGVLAQRPGARIVLASVVEAHHDVARFAWRVVSPDGTTLREGIDFVEIARDGKLRRVVGFFGALAPA